MHRHKKTDSLKIGKFVPLSSSTTNSDHSSRDNQKVVYIGREKPTTIQKSQTTFNNSIKVAQKRSAIQTGTIYNVPNKFIRTQSEYEQSIKDKLSINIIQSPENINNFPICIQQQQCEVPDINFQCEQLFNSTLIKKEINQKMNTISNQKTQRIPARFVKNPFALYKELDKNSYVSQELESSLSSSYFKQRTDRAKFLQSQVLEARQQIQRLFQIIDHQSNAIGVLRQKLERYQNKQAKISHELEIQTLKNKKLTFLLEQAEKQRNNSQQKEQKNQKNTHVQTQNKDLSKLSNKLQNWQLMLYLIFCLVISKLF